MSVYNIKVCFPIEDSCFNENDTPVSLRNAMETFRNDYFKKVKDDQVIDYWDAFLQIVARWYLADNQNWFVEFVDPETKEVQSFSLDDVYDYLDRSNSYLENLNDNEMKIIELNGKKYKLIEEE